MQNAPGSIMHSGRSRWAVCIRIWEKATRDASAFWMWRNVLTRHVTEHNDVVTRCSPKQVQGWEGEASRTVAFNIDATGKQHIKRKRKGKDKGHGKGEIPGARVPQL